MISSYTLPGTIVGKTTTTDVNWTIGIKQLMLSKEQLNPIYKMTEVFNWNMDNLKFDRRRFIKYYEKNQL